MAAITLRADLEATHSFVPSQSEHGGRTVTDLTSSDGSTDVMQCTKTVIEAYLAVLAKKSPERLDKHCPTFTNRPSPSDYWTEMGVKPTYPNDLSNYIENVKRTLPTVLAQTDEAKSLSPEQVDWALAEKIAACRNFPLPFSEVWSHPLDRLACCVKYHKNRAQWRDQELARDALSSECQFLITSLCEFGYYDIVKTLIAENVPPKNQNDLAWPLVIKSLVSKNRLNDAERIMLGAQDAAKSREVFVCLLIKAKRLNKAQEVVDQAPDNEKKLLQGMVDTKRLLTT